VPDGVGGDGFMWGVRGGPPGAGGVSQNRPLVAQKGPYRAGRGRQFIGESPSLASRGLVIATWRSPRARVDPTNAMRGARCSVCKRAAADARALGRPARSAITACSPALRSVMRA
jgi:hypothetical protein